LILQHSNSDRPFTTQNITIASPQKTNSDRPINTPQHHDRLSTKIKQRSPPQPQNITIATPQN
jgi:hypothetical protein